MRFSGTSLYQHRLKQNMSRADLAHAIRRSSHGQIKATERGVRGWEKNEYAPRGEAIPALAAALGCEMSELYETNGATADDDEESDPVVSFESAVAHFNAAAAAAGRKAAIDALREHGVAVLS